MKNLLRSFVSPLIIPLMLIIGLASPTDAQGKKKFTEKDLPNAIQTSFQKSYPAASITGVGKEVERATTYYEVESLDGTTRRDILFTEDGRIEEVEEAIDAKSLPKAVITTLNKKYPNNEIKKAEKTTRGSVAGYEVVLNKDRKTYEITLDPSGKILKTEVMRVKPEEDEDENDD